MEDRKRKKLPYLAAGLSLLFPGLGQIYNGQFRKGLSLLALVFVVNSLAGGPVETAVEVTRKGTPEDIPSDTMILIFGYCLAMIFLVGISVYDANATAKKINEGRLD